MKTIGNKSSQLSSKNKSQYDRKEAEGQFGDDIESVEIPVPTKEDEISFRNGTAAEVRFFNVSEDHQTELFVKIEQIDNSDIPQRSVGSSHIILFCAPFGICGSDYFRSTILVTFHPWVNAEVVKISWRTARYLAVMFCILGRCCCC